MTVPTTLWLSFCTFGGSQQGGDVGTLRRVKHDANLTRFFLFFLSMGHRSLPTIQMVVVFVNERIGSLWIHHDSSVMKVGPVAY